MKDINAFFEHFAELGPDFAAVSKAITHELSGGTNLCANCELPVGKSAPPERQWVVIQNGRIYCDDCAHKAE